MLYKSVYVYISLYFPSNPRLRFANSDQGEPLV